MLSKMKNLLAYDKDELSRLLEEADDALVAKENDEWALKNVIKDSASSQLHWEVAMKELHAFTKEHKIKLHEKYKR